MILSGLDGRAPHGADISLCELKLKMPTMFFSGTNIRLYKRIWKRKKNRTGNGLGKNIDFAYYSSPFKNKCSAVYIVTSIWLTLFNIFICRNSFTEGYRWHPLFANVFRRCSQFSLNFTANFFHKIWQLFPPLISQNLLNAFGKKFILVSVCDL